ncbi:MAG TPA: SpoIID/LytB domain-containing protein [Actinomycetes bacterium]|nr:SpoIID/LytB domain-containing protein [Actinomycetes bacterium]
MTGVTSVTGAGAALRGAIAAIVMMTGVALPVIVTTPALATESYAVPASRTLVLSGLGFGHGIGMSQFGAEGMGRLGKSYRQILTFYYPGTSMDHVSAQRSIRVSLSGIVRYGGGRPNVMVKPRSGLHAVNNGNNVALPTRFGGSAVTKYGVLHRDHSLEVRAYNGTDSIRVKSGLNGTVRFLTDAGRTSSHVTLLSASGSARTYRGFVDVHRSDSGLLVISNLLLEDYLRSVVSAEVPGSWTSAALRAQAVAARSYALLAQVNARADHRAYDICDTTYCQVYGAMGSESKPESAAVRRTAGQYLKSGGTPAFTMFSSANGGYSVSGSRSYLVAKADPYDGVVTGSANWGHSWEQTITAASVQHAWPQIGKLKKLKVLRRDGNGQWGGRVLRVALVGSRDSMRVSGDSFRWAMGLKSTWWTVTNVAGDTKAAPREVRADAQDRAVRVRWRAPRTNKTVRGYAVTVQPGDRHVRVAATDRRERVTGLTNGREYRATVRAIYRSGPSHASAGPAFVPSSEFSYYRPMASNRLLDLGTTRASADHAAATIRVVGRSRAPDSGSRAVTLRVTATGGAHSGRVFAWPSAKPDQRLVAATFGAHSTGSGLVNVRVDGSGKVAIGTSATVKRLKVDLLGYYTRSGIRTDAMHAVPAREVVNSATAVHWDGGRLRHEAPLTVRVAGRAGVPHRARTVLVSVGLVRPTENAGLSLGPAGTSQSLGLVVRAASGQVRRTTSVVRLDADGRMPLRLSAGRADVSVDVLGWFSRQDGGRGGRYRSVTPLSVLSASGSETLGAGKSRTVRVRGDQTGIPGSASAVVLQALTRHADGSGSIAVVPAGSQAAPRPLVSFERKRTERSLLVVPVGRDGSIVVSAKHSAVDVSLQVVGWYS